jgi:predicted DCC family thiol-disulfide oxidoreductase YuxK
LSRTALLAYDDQCGPCSRFKRVVEFIDARDRITFVSLRQAEAAGDLSAVRPSLRNRSFHLAIEGNGVLSGSEALLPLAGTMFPGGKAWTLVGSVPGLRRSLAFLYSTLSRLHGVGACAKEHSAP